MPFESAAAAAFDRGTQMPLCNRAAIVKRGEILAHLNPIHAFGGFRVHSQTRFNPDHGGSITPIAQLIRPN
jgi:hypothetical protein